MTVVVVGAGLAGLSCAIELDRVGIDWMILEASDGVGGRVRTDLLDGFTLDRGFQVLLTAYPECRRLLDYDALDLQYFEPGALVFTGSGFHRVSDPLRRPAQALATATAPIGTLADKVRVARLGAVLRSRMAHRLMDGPDITTLEFLRRQGFSDTFIATLMQPLFAGIQLDATLATSSRAFAFVFGMLARGEQTIPAAGMQAIPEQLADRLDRSKIHLSRPASAVGSGQVRCADGDVLEASAVVVATDGPSAARLVDDIADPGSNGVTAVYFAAEHFPIDDPIILLDAANSGPVNNLVDLSQVAPSYAPPGSSLLCASVLQDDMNVPDTELSSAVRAQMQRWFGATVADWRHLRTDRIVHAQPAQPAGSLSPPGRDVRVRKGVYCCGDHRDDASLNGAMVSGRRAAEAIANDQE